MTTYFLDSSALVKNYVTETGSVWVISIVEPESGNAIAIAHITVAEVAAGLASKLRGQFISVVNSKLLSKISSVMRQKDSSSYRLTSKLSNAL